MRNIRIMIVESSRSLVDQLSKKLQDWGFSVCGRADTGVEAIRMAQDLQPDLILLRRNLPGNMDGLQLADEINLRCPAPIIFTTDFEDTSALENIAIDEPRIPIVNPFQDEFLSEKIEATLKKHQLEYELVTKREHYRTIVEDSPLGIVILDDAYQPVYVNERTTHILGYSQDEIIGQDWRSIIGSDSLEMVEQRYLARQQGALAPSKYEAFIYHKDGQRRCIEISASTLKDEDGSVRTVALLSDITEAKEIENEVKEHQRYLGMLVTEQTIALMNVNRRLQEEIHQRERVEASLKQHMEQLDLINLLGQQFSVTQSVDQVASASLEFIVANLEPQLAMITLKQGDELALQRIYPADRNEDESYNIHAVGDCLCGLAATLKRPLYSDDIHEDVRCTLNECKQNGMNSVAALPLLADQEVLGVLGIASTDHIDYSTRSAFLQALTGEIAVGLQNALLHQELQAHTAKLEGEISERKQAQQKTKRIHEHQVAINQLSIRLSQQKRLNEIYHTVYEHIAVWFDVRTFIISSYNPETALIHAEFLAEGGILPDVNTLPPAPVVPQRPGTQSYVIETGEPYYVPDKHKVGRAAEAAYTIKNNGPKVDDPHPNEAEAYTRTVLFAPLNIAGQTFGVMQIQSFEPDAYTLEQQNLFIGLANVVAAAIHNARLFEQLQTELAAHRETEAQLQRHRDNLEELVDERTLELISANLKLRQEMDKRQQTAKALEESERRFRQVVERSPMLIAIQKPDKITYINPAGAQILGEQDPSRLEGKSLLDFVSSENRLELYERFMQLANIGEDLPIIEQTVVRQDGERIELEISATVTQQANEDLVQVIAWDITERKVYQEALRRQAALAEIELAINQPAELQRTLDRIVEITTQMVPATAGACVALWDENANDFLVNSSTVAQPMKAIVERYIRRPNSPFYWIIQNKQMVITPDISKDLFGKNATLTRHHIRSSAGIPLIFEEEVLGVLLVLNNEVREYSKQDIDFLAGLANRAALALAKIRLYDSLLQARAAAEETARAKEQFLANMSHELRTPLTAVVSFSELLKESPINDQQSDLIHMISNSAQKLLLMINDVLDFSKLEADKLALEARPFDLRPSIEEVLNLVKLEAKRKGNELAYYVEGEVPNHLLGDAHRLSQVLTNLLDNAVKFTEGGEITLLVNKQNSSAQQTGAGAPDQNYVDLLFTIRDTGIGIPPEKVSTLFNPFQQIDSSTTRKFGGTGLGLAISKQLVNLMGGDIWVESSGAPGEGAAFHFTIRVLHTDSPAPPCLQKGQPLLKDKRVVLISPHRNQRQVIADLLVAWGMHVFTFEGSQHAQTWLKERIEFDLVIIETADFTEDRKFVDSVKTDRNAGSLSFVIITPAENWGDSNWPVKIAAWLETPILPARLHKSLVRIFSDRTAGEQPILDDLVSRSQRHSVNILIAEDDPTSRKALTMLLDHLDYPYQAVTNGIELISAFENEAFDILLVDRQMPEMDGLSAVRYICDSIPAARRPFLIALTADAREKTVQEMIAAGVDEFLAKPVRIEQLTRALERAVYRHSGDGRAEARISAEVGVSPDRGGPIDEEILADFIGMMGESAEGALDDLIHTFFENAPGLLRSMRNAAHEGNWSQLKWAAHTLKGNCELLGGVGLAAMCKEIENMIDLGDTGVLVEQIERVECEYGAVKAALMDINLQR